MTKINKVCIYYNSACPVCDAGIKHQRSKTVAPNYDLTWHDIHENKKAREDIPTHLEQLRERLHAKDSQGNIQVGIDAFITIWQTSPNEKWKAELFQAPGIHFVTSILYKLFAKGLYRWNRFKNHW